MKKLIFVMSIYFLCIASCTIRHFGDIKPVYPKIETGILTPRTVDSLSPNFMWENKATGSFKYDFAIWLPGETFDYGSGIGGMELGLCIYYREGLNQPEHKIEISLSPNTTYYWSVRTRSGNTVSAWSTYDFKEIGISEGSGWPFRFTTPKTGIN